MEIVGIGVVYKIVNIIDGKIYVGSTINARRRRYDHRRDLKIGKHSCIHLQNAYNKHGIDAFRIFDIIETIELPAIEDSNEARRLVWRPIVLAREQHYLDTLIPEYNDCRIAGSRLGTAQNFTEEQKEAHRQRMLGNQHTKGHKLTEEHKQAVGDWHRGKKRSQETIERMRQGQFDRDPKTLARGWKQSDEVKAKLSEQRMGVPLSPEHAEKARISAAKGRENSPANKPGWIPEHRIGTTHTDDTKVKMSAAQKGHTRNQDPETLAKMQKAHKAHWDRRRASGTTGLKLTDEQIIEAFLSTESAMAIAERWGISNSTINKIRQRKLNPSVTAHLERPAKSPILRRKTVGRPIGSLHSEETKAKMSQDRKGHKHFNPEIIPVMQAAGIAYRAERKAKGLSGL